jgi:Bacterial PH domain
MDNPHFKAPWSTTLKLMTLLCCVICGGIALAGILYFTGNPGSAKWSMIGIPLLILIGSAPFMVRGYTLEDRRLIIHRLGWTTHFDLSSLNSATPDPQAMARSIRLFGNGGLFSFCGLFHNRHLGNYRAFATAPQNSVVLRFPDRTLVVTPDDPQRFADEITKRSHKHSP